MPVSRPSRLPRVETLAAVLVPDVVDGAVGAIKSCRSYGSAGWVLPEFSRLATETPTRVSPRRAMSGSSRSTSARTVASTTWVWAVGSCGVCDRVARRKSSYQA